MTDYQRIKAILDLYSISANKLARELGLKSPQVFYDIKAGKCGISKDIAQKLQEKFLNINSGWLLTGEGQMLNNNSIQVRDVNGDGNSISQDNHQYYSDSPDVLRAQIDQLEAMLREKEARIAEKDKQIAEKDKQIAGLIAALTK